MPFVDPDTGREKGDGFRFEVGDRDPVVTGWGTGGGSSEPPAGGPGGFAELLIALAGAASTAGEAFGPRRKRMGAPGMPLARAPIPAYAGGTPDQMGGLMALLAMLMGRHPGGPAIVGEEGPELVDLPAGSSVTPNQMMGTVPQYANGTPNFWGLSRQDLINRKRYGAPQPAGPAGSPGQPAGNGLPAGWAERGGGRPSDIQLGGMFGPNGQISYPQLLDHLTAKSIQGGAFDPLGSQGMADMARTSITSSMGARERAATLGADMDSGGDPALRAFGRLQARLNTQGEGSNAYVNALLQSAQQNQSFLQQLFGARQGAILKKDPKDNSWAQVGGQVGGALIPGLGG